MAQLHVPAASVAVVKAMEIVWTEAWGVLKLGKPAQATPSTLFQSASISKAVAAVGALCLVRDGQLSPDDDIATVLHSWHLPQGKLYRASHPAPSALPLRRDRHAGL